LAITPDARAYFLPDRVVFRTRDGAFQVEFLDTEKNAEIRGEDPQGTRVNYIVGRQPQEWSKDLPAYGKLLYHGIYPGIDIHRVRTRGRSVSGTAGWGLRASTGRAT
jgi:hypothetical protein